MSTLCVVTFVGFLAGVLAFISTSSLKNEEFEEDSEEDSEEEFENEFTNYLANRLDTSKPFRSKVLIGLTMLHEQHPQVYSEVMKQSK